VVSVTIRIEADSAQDALCGVGDAVRMLERHGLQSGSTEGPGRIVGVVVVDDREKGNK
jgi:hypothetical protein